MEKLYVEKRRLHDHKSPAPKRMSGIFNFARIGSSSMLYLETMISECGRKARYFLARTPQRFTKMFIHILWCFALAFPVYSGKAGALSLELQESRSPRPGLVLERYRAANPAANVWVTRVDICAPRIWVDATTTPSALQTTGSWGNSRGVQAAINGDFYTLTPQLHVYGQAVGDGIPWPLRKTGLHDDYANDWYFGKYGWVAFGPDWVKYTYTRWVKRQDELFPVLSGHRPNQVNPPLPAGTLALISGFPTLVVEGNPIICSSPTATTCFPDRSDMRARHPRSAVGISADQKTLFLVVVDGRTSQSSGMYGVELASLMHQLGAFFALNLDGGGSSQMWLSGEGYVNDRVGNNGGNGTRSVANHLGVFAGAAGSMPFRPGHCHESPPCQSLPNEGGLIEDDSSCFHAFGPEAYWRVENAGHGGSLHWTNASTAARPSNWAWWQIFLDEAGTYEVEFWAEPGYAVFANTRYEIRHAGQSDSVFVDQQSDVGWRSLGRFDFASGGQQWVAIYDDTPDDIATGQHIAADAIRLRRIVDNIITDAGTPEEASPGYDAGPPQSYEDAGAVDSEWEYDAGSSSSSPDVSEPVWPPAATTDAGPPPFVDGIAYLDGGVLLDASAQVLRTDSGGGDPAIETGSMSCQSSQSFKIAWGLASGMLFFRQRRKRTRRA